MEFILGALSILLGFLAILFSRDLSKRTDNLIKSVSESTHALIQSEDKRVKELIAKMDERTIEQSRILERIEETQKYVAELVRIEGEKTRSLISH